MNPYFMDRAAKIIAEVRTRTCINKLDAKVIEDILQDELIKYRNEVFTYGHSIGYDDGYIAGDEAGYERGHNEGESDGYVDGYDWLR